MATSDTLTGRYTEQYRDVMHDTIIGETSPYFRRRILASHFRPARGDSEVSFLISNDEGTLLGVDLSRADAVRFAREILALVGAE